MKVIRGGSPEYPVAEIDPDYRGQHGDYVYPRMMEGEHLFDVLADLERRGHKGSHHWHRLRAEIDRRINLVQALGVLEPDSSTKPSLETTMMRQFDGELTKDKPYVVRDSQGYIFGPGTEAEARQTATERSALNKSPSVVFKVAFVISPKFEVTEDKWD